MNLIQEIIYRIRGEFTTKKLISMGLQVGHNFQRMKGAILDPSHCWLIEIGNNVTLAPNVHILCHDASTKQFLGKAKIGRVNIGNNVFVGASTVVLPGVTIGDNVIIGANSTVTRDIPEGTVAAGCPARIICTLQDYLAKEKSRMQTAPAYDKAYTLQGNISVELKAKQKKDLENTMGYII